MPSRLIILFASFIAATGSIDVIFVIVFVTKFSVSLNLSFASLNIFRSVTFGFFSVLGALPYIISLSLNNSPNFLLALFIPVILSSTWVMIPETVSS